MEASASFIYGTVKQGNENSRFWNMLSNNINDYRQSWRYQQISKTF